MSMVNERSLITGLISSNAVDYELPVLRQMEKLGGQYSADHRLGPASIV